MLFFLSLNLKLAVLLNEVCECFVFQLMDLEPKYAGRFEESLETTKKISSHSDEENILNNKTEVKSLHKQ